MATESIAALLDTNILLALVNPAEPTPDLGDCDEVFVSSLSWAELVRGLHSSVDLLEYKRRRRNLDQLAELFGEGVPFGDECLGSYDLVLDALAERGKSLRANLMDHLIAATAHTHELTIVTRDRLGFVGLEEFVPIIER